MLPLPLVAPAPAAAAATAAAAAATVVVAVILLRMTWFRQAAVTDATKRALRLFGTQLGGSMANKEVGGGLFGPLTQLVGSMANGEVWVRLKSRVISVSPWYPGQGGGSVANKEENKVGVESFRFGSLRHSRLLTASPDLNIPQRRRSFISPFSGRERDSGDIAIAAAGCGSARIPECRSLSEFWHLPRGPFDCERGLMWQAVNP